MSLEKVLNAKSVAIVGASKNETKRGYQAIRILLDEKFGGKIYPVNPKESSILGLKCYSKVSEIDGPVDMALITTPAKTIPAILDDRARLQKNIMAMAEYIYVVVPGNFVLKPSVLYAYTDPLGNFGDINLNSMLFDMASVQVSYRTNQNMFVTVGYHSVFSVLLSYQFSIGDVASFGHGTYELMLTYAFSRNPDRRTRFRLPWNWTY